MLMFKYKIYAENKCNACVLKISSVHGEGVSRILYLINMCTVYSVQCMYTVYVYSVCIH